MSIVVGVTALFVFALFDYFGYTYFYFLSKVRIYRLLQGIFQVLLSVFCFYLEGIKSVVIFNILWWTWSADWIFYLYCLIFNFRGNRKDWLQPFRGHVRWAFWTPVGLMQLIFKGKEKISAQEGRQVSIYRIIKPLSLILQSLLGIFIVILIYFYL